MTDEKFFEVSRDLEKQYNQFPIMNRRSFEAFLANQKGYSVSMTLNFVKLYIHEGKNESLKATLKREFNLT